MRFKGIKFGMPTREEVKAEFDKELFSRVEKIMRAATAGKGILEYAKYKQANGEQVRVAQKIKLLQEYEAKGRSTAFNEEPIGYLIAKKYNAH